MNIRLLMPIIDSAFTMQNRANIFWIMTKTVSVLLLVTGILPASGQIRPDSAAITIKVKTHGSYPASRLQDEAGLRSSRPVQIQEMPASLGNLLEVLRSHEYYFARIDSLSTEAGDENQSLQGTAYISEGRRWRIQLLGRNPAGGAVARLWEESTRRPMREAQVMESADRVLRYSAQQGYPLATLIFDSIAIDQELAVAFLHTRFDTGPLVTIDSIVVRGNRITKREVITRELPLRPGDIFRLDRVDEIPARLMRLGFFHRVVPPQLLRDVRGRFLLDLEIVEGGANTFNGVAGYNPGSGNEKGYLTGLIDLNFGNLFGTGRQLGARWEKRSRETQELALRYREPWLFGYPLHLAGAFQQLVQDTIYVERQVELSVEWPATPRLTVFGSLSRQSVSPDSLASERLLLPKSRVLGATFGIAYNSLDDLLNPRRGVAYRTTIESGRKKISALREIPSSSIHRQRLTVDLQVVVPTLRAQVLSLALHGRQVTSGEPFVSITDEFRLGGATSLRGYREDQFRGSRVGWSNIEYRYLLGPRSRAFVFADLGYFFKQTADARIEEFKSAFGLGARVETPLGVVGVDYGLGEGDGLLAGKVHVSLVNSF
jgi:outer membrane protein insertion porin family